ncbi:RICIN domain-containing protein [Winogradskya humida]|uniref:Ricin B lectin domain-containing protein n=1 Tax=Winogradskya humida TaxID=113566 RepID=A0ABQ4A354_9ACTN|nr:ricin-type beta-trefoil lectin domain protein [Actinoplanes humidus]GIE25272.1 hypothetical protein Ahu01nite_083740 [Actinoplanes humidus]
MITTRRFGKGLRRRFDQRPDSDEGSMAMAMMVTLVAMTLTAGLVPLVLNQLNTTRTVDARTVSLDAAQAGIDAAVGQLRGSTSLTTLTDGTTKLVGSLLSLPPCLVSGTADPIAGITSSVAVLRYNVKIAYYGVPDAATDETPTLLSCPTALLPLTTVPSTAVLTSTGSSSPTGSLDQGSTNTRTIQATYTFKVNNENITGGAIQLAAPTTNPLCMDAGPTASPAAGAAATVALCKTGGSSDQRFAYTTDLAIKLIGSETSAAPTGMCLEAPVPHATDGAVTFQPCAGRVAKQQWSLDDNSNFRGTGNGVSLDSFCLNAKTAGSAGPIVLGSCSGTTNKNVFRSQAGVGAGMASATTKQLVNYKQFSRCLDVTNFDYTNKNVGYEIVWYCKQAPDGNVPINQQWVLPAISLDLATAVTGRIRTPAGYCLKTPTTTAGYVTMAACTLTGILTDPNLGWKVYGDTGNYATSYRIVDANGYCLTPTDLTVANPDTHSDGTAKVKVAPCTSSELQKWNAPANFNQPLAVTNTQEK